MSRPLAGQAASSPIASLPTLAALGLALGCGARTGFGLLTTEDAGPTNDATLDATADAHADDAPPSTDAILPSCTAADAGRDAGPCVGLACQIPTCSAGHDTTITGVTYAPNGTLPLFNVEIFIPNAGLEPIPRGVQCARCGANVSGDPITTTYSLPDGHFTLTGVPTGHDIPIVVQLGKWRRMATIPTVEPCTTNALTDPELTRLPKNQNEGSIPHIALTTGACDNVGCILPKVGIDLSEFGYEADGYAKAVNIYNGDESALGSSGGYALPATPAMHLWGSASQISTYDLAIFSCECTQAPNSKGHAGSPSFGVVTDYLNAGGRIFTTDFQYTWYKYSPDPNLGGSPVGSGTADIGIGEIVGGAPQGGSTISLDTTFPKGAALAEWLMAVFPGDAAAKKREVHPDLVFSNIQRLDATKTLTWATSPHPAGPRIFSVDTPVGAPSGEQCGRGVHIDAHIDQQNDTGDLVACIDKACYPSTCPGVMRADEAMFAFFFFNLSSCSETCD